VPQHVGVNGVVGTQVATLIAGGALIPAGEKVVWQQMAQHWLRMVPKTEPAEAEQGEGN
jgi:hypothetical protein